MSLARTCSFVTTVTIRTEQLPRHQMLPCSAFWSQTIPTSNSLMPLICTGTYSKWISFFIQRDHSASVTQFTFPVCVMFLVGPMVSPAWHITPQTWGASGLKPKTRHLNLNGVFLTPCLIAFRPAQRINVKYGNPLLSLKPLPISMTLTTEPKVAQPRKHVLTRHCSLTSSIPDNLLHAVYVLLATFKEKHVYKNNKFSLQN